MTPARLLFVDIETDSAEDLVAVGAWKYAQGDTRIGVVGYAYDDDPGLSWDRTQGDPPAALLRALEDPAIVKIAHNAAFEIACLCSVWGVRFLPEQWRCTQALALSLSLPAALGQVAEVLGFPADKQKDKTGRALIKLFSIGRADPADHPVEWAQFIEYCMQDVEVEREIWRRLSPWQPSPEEWRVWELDQRINARGLPVDVDLVEAALDADARHRAALMEEARAITGLDNPNSRAQILAWLEAEEDTALDGLTKADVKGALKSWDGSLEGARVLEIRQELAKTSVKKYEVLARATGSGNRLRGCFQYCGASRTGRWAGRLFQPQNLPSGSISVESVEAARNAIVSGDLGWVEMLFGSISETLASMVRPAIAAPHGYRLVSADFSSIESVLVGWAAGEEKILDVFRNGRDLYRVFASSMFGVEYDDVTDPQRKIAKPPVLGCGYALGASGLVAYAESWGIPMSEEEASKAVRTFRETFSEIPRFWRRLESATFAAVRRPGEITQAGAFKFKVEDTREGRILFARLPSGRKLAYWHPEIDPSGRFGKPSLTYMGMNQTTRKWIRTDTHPGKIVENLVQAVSRDLLAEALLRVEDAGFEIVGHVHDEIIAMVPDGSPLGVSDLIQAMTQPVAWCAGAPIKAAGWQGRFFRK